MYSLNVTSVDICPNCSKYALGRRYTETRNVSHKAKRLATPKYHANVYQTSIHPRKRLKGKENQIVKDIQYREESMVIIQASPTL